MQANDRKSYEIKPSNEFRQRKNPSNFSEQENNKHIKRSDFSAYRM